MPGPKRGVAPPLHPPGTIASLSLWRDWATIWESRAELFAPEVVQGFAKLDTAAGQFFGAREFGDVLAAFDPHWRLVVAQQDYAAMKPAPDTKLPAFAVVAELNGSQEDFADRLKVAFQAIIGISNVEADAEEGRRPRAGSEEVDGDHHDDHEIRGPAEGGRPPSEPGAHAVQLQPLGCAGGPILRLQLQQGPGPLAGQGAEIAGRRGEQKPSCPARSPSRPTDRRPPAGWSREVRTVESLDAADGKLNALQQAFRNNHALQCGFCTPGILMSFTDFLARNPHPSEAEIREVSAATSAAAPATPASSRRSKKSQAATPPKPSPLW